MFYFLENLAHLTECLGSPNLRLPGCSLQAELAKCVRKCNAAGQPPNQIHTLFTSTIPKLINFPKSKEAYVSPVIQTWERNTCWDLQKNGWDELIDKFLHLGPIAEGVYPTPEAWVLVAPAGQGKSRFSFELEKKLAKVEQRLENKLYLTI